uniref:Uncharacterized protein n=1 Tax=Anguilla anguilla TaxID=7936 RepID=A0A0E9XD44_ANGAN
MAYANPRIPLPMMAFPRLNTDIPKEVLPSKSVKRIGFFPSEFGRNSSHSVTFPSSSN